MYENGKNETCGNSSRNVERLKENYRGSESIYGIL
jgi:hypothetical protein